MFFNDLNRAFRFMNFLKQQATNQRTALAIAA
jgi:hypothetical protein